MGNIKIMKPKRRGFHLVTSEIMSSARLLCKNDYRRMKHKGIICGILAAVCYGTNPFGALPLYEEGVNTASVLFLGMLFAASSITYYQSFHFMDAGIASTILFVYPVMVAVIMATFFREKVTASTVTSIILALVGIGLLYKGDAGVSLSTMGVLLVMVSSLTLTFYVLLICMLCLLAYSFTSPDLYLMLPPSPRAWFFACWLGLVPTVLSLVFMTIAVHEVGATPTAIMGALEPLTAVAIGVMVFDESLTFRLAVGIVLILSAVLLIVMGKSFHLRTITHDRYQQEQQDLPIPLSVG